MDKMQLFRKILATVFALTLIVSASLHLPQWVSILSGIMVIVLVFWPTKSEK